MKSYSKDLKEGAKFISQKKYTRAIRFLEPKVPIYMEDDSFYYLLGLALYHSGDVGGARFYFERGLLANRENGHLRLMLALAHLKRKDTAAAAKVWLSILEDDPSNKRAERGLESLRKIDNEKDLKAYIESGNHKKLMPPFKKSYPGLLYGLSSLFLLAILIMAFPFLPLDKIQEKTQREELNYIDLDITGIPVTNSSGAFHYVHTVDEINQIYNKAIELFDENKDNMCQVEINKILNSNASGGLKSRLSTLEGYLQKPDYLDFYTDYSFKQITNDPLLYENTWVKWRGRVTNLVVEDDQITFLFLVGFENETFLEGSIQSFIDFGVKIDRELPVEVMGRLIRQEGELLLYVDTIRHILPKDM